ncbi:hypothetical protein E2C01_051502 [Portunus trituberculatus]|uniref:Uncharacterized protein n=1 Tax=Portunus trituberculatus TaxID=210409 RepID=A0A5B7GBS5_PORTR|nr:hypothetical protein [Portunus trituberculatus]
MAWRGVAWRGMVWCIVSCRAAGRCGAGRDMKTTATQLIKEVVRGQAVPPRGSAIDLIEEFRARVQLNTGAAARQAV